MPVFIPFKEIPKGLPNTAITEIRKELEKADRNKDGRYTRDELKKALKNLGAYFPGWRAHRCLVKADANNDGRISGDEIDTLVDYLLSRGFGKNN